MKKAKQRSATSVDHDIGTRIRAYRNATGLSQEVLGQKLGVSFQQVQKYEKGVNRVSPERLMKIAVLLEVSANTLLGIEDGSQPAMNGETAELLSFMGKQGNLRLIRACMKLTIEQRHRLTEFVEEM